MKPNVIALTGKIGSGKSTVARILSDRGFKVVDCDVLSRRVAEEEEVLQQVRALLGADSVVDGKLNRKFVRAKIFADKQLHSSYSAIFWDRIKKKLCNEVRCGEDVVFVEIPVIDAFDFDWDEIWLVECSVENTVNRVAARDAVSEENVLAVLSRQSSGSHCTRKIVNDGSFDDLESNVDLALQKLKKR